MKLNIVLILAIFFIFNTNCKSELSNGRFYYPEFPKYETKLTFMTMDIPLNSDSANLLLSEFHEDCIGIILSDYNEKEIDCILQGINDKEILRIKAIVIDNSKIEKLPESIGRFRFLNTLHFRSCDSLKDIGAYKGGEALRSMSASLIFQDCFFKHIPFGTEKIKKMLNLKIIYSEDHTGAVFNYDEELKIFLKRNNVITLDITDHNIEYFPKILYNFTNLTYFKFNCPRVLDLKDNFNLFPNLMELYLPINQKEYFKTIIEHEVLTIVSFGSYTYYKESTYKNNYFNQHKISDKPNK